MREFQVCQYIASQSEKLVAMYGNSICKPTVRFEVIISKGQFQYQTHIGFIDLIVTDKKKAKYEELDEDTGKRKICGYEETRNIIN